MSDTDLTSGVQMLQSGQLAAAADFFATIVQREQGNGPAFGYLGITLAKLGQHDHALNALGQASQLQPQDPAAQFNVAIGLMHAGRTQEAVPFLQFTLQLEPSHAQARSALESLTPAQAAPPQPAGPVYPTPAPLTGPVMPASPQGMHYRQAPRQQAVTIAPSIGTRMLRGLAYGALWGQVWMAWILFWDVLWSLGHVDVIEIIFAFVIIFVVCGASGAAVGFIVALCPPSVSTAAAVGVVGGLALFALEMAHSRSGFLVINIFFWFSTGRYIGANIGVRVHRAGAPLNLCAACHKTNLPGGVRCVYCGEHFPPKLNFQIGAAVTAAPQRVSTSSIGDSGQSQNNRGRQGGLAGTIAILALKAKSLIAMLKLGKILLTFSTMIISIWAYSHIFGYRFAVGFVVCIFVHEMGHITVNIAKGLKCTAPMFIPFVGAVIFVKRFPDDPTIESESGAGGPAAGLLAGMVCLLIGLFTGAPFWFALAGIDALINLFNMIPFPPLDGSHIGAVFSPKLWTTLLVTLLLWVIKLGFQGHASQFAAMTLFIVIVGFLFRLGNSKTERHLLAVPAVRVRMAFVFVGLCVSLSYVGMASFTHLAAARQPGAVSWSAATSSIMNRFGADEDLAAKSAPEPARHINMLIAVQALTTVLVLLGMVYTSLLFLSAFLLTRAASAKRIVLSLPVTMMPIGTAIAVYIRIANPLTDTAFGLVGAFTAATLALLTFAIYSAVHKQQAAVQGVTFVTLHALAWGGSVALITAYAQSSGMAATIILLTALCFIGISLWLIPYIAASVFLLLGRANTSLEYFNSALRLAPPIDAIRHINELVAELNITRSRGEAALAALDSICEIDVRNDHAPTIRDLHLRAAAQTLMERYDDALESIEQLLGILESDPDIYIRLRIAHTLLAKMAGLRGWYDECAAQVESALLRTPNTERTARALLLLEKAGAMADSGSLADAEALRNDAVMGAKGTDVRERAACVAARILIAGKQPDEAIKVIDLELRSTEGDLELNYLRACAVRDSGHMNAAARAFKAVAASSPRDHWGIAAAAAS